MHYASILLCVFVVGCSSQPGKQPLHFSATAHASSAPAWQVSLDDELKKTAEARRDVLYSFDGGYARILVTPAMVRIFETVSKSELKLYLSKLTSKDVPKETRLDPEYVRLCLHAIETKAHQTALYKMSVTDKNEVVMKEFDVVYYLIPLSDVLE